MYILSYLYRKSDSVSDGTITMAVNQCAKFTCKLIQDHVYHSVDTGEFRPGIYLCKYHSCTANKRTYYYTIVHPEPLTRMTSQEIVDNFPRIFDLSYRNRVKKIDLFLPISNMRSHEDIQNHEVDLGNGTPKYTVVKIPQDFINELGSAMVFHYPDNPDVINIITYFVAHIKLIQFALKSLGISGRIIDRYCITNDHMEETFIAATQYGIIQEISINSADLSSRILRLMEMNGGKRNHIFYYHIYRMPNRRTCEMAFFNRKELYAAILYQEITRDNILDAISIMDTMRDHCKFMIEDGGFH